MYNMILCRIQILSYVVFGSVLGSEPPKGSVSGLASPSIFISDCESAPPGVSWLLLDIALLSDPELVLAGVTWLEFVVVSALDVDPPPPGASTVLMASEPRLFGPALLSLGASAPELGFAASFDPVPLWSTYAYEVGEGAALGLPEVGCVLKEPSAKEPEPSSISDPLVSSSDVKPFVLPAPAFGGGALINSCCPPPFTGFNQPPFPSPGKHTFNVSKGFVMASSGWSQVSHITDYMYRRWCMVSCTHQ